MPSQAYAQSELSKFQRSLQRLDNTRDRMERLFAQEQIRKVDLDSVYEALFLRAVTSFEAFLEDLFLAILVGRAQYTGQRVRVLMSASSRGALMKILLQGSVYMNWLPFEHTEKRAKLYLRDGRPFSDLDIGDRSQLKTISIIRNAIAHKSPYALAQFQKIVIGGAPMLQRERNPAGFLRSRIAPQQTRFEVHMGQLARCAGLLC
ncbi:MAG: hypothetical protein JHD07_22555 [Bradyrhizobium sp.]|uniref:hypothetical protein n=1 Tax=Bradyrhizobium sp. TaxID=376 RepID=UPI001A266C68|nr:hypothetical protein [Bradyrhizobium sp.]MBJ7405939.1 hypothetical protein [Bradyrhizobium sp.]